MLDPEVTIGHFKSKRYATVAVCFADDFAVFIRSMSMLGKYLEFGKCCFCNSSSSQTLHSIASKIVNHDSSAIYEITSNKIWTSNRTHN